MQKPFHLKMKLFYQTKINLWGYDESFLKEKLKKKKWSFLKKKLKKKTFFSGKLKNSKISLDTFSYSPFSRSFFNQRVSNNFKNNLYFRKLVRLKYGRLKNKELYKIFCNSKGYKNFLQNLGSRLDVNLFNILFPASIFSLRQNILHGKILLNGYKVKSPNIQLKAFDVISLKLFDVFSFNYLYNDSDGLIKYLNYLIYHLFYLVRFEYLSEEVRGRFISDLSLKLGGDNHEAFNEFLSGGFNDLCSNEILSNKSKKLILAEELDVDKIILILNKKYIKQKYLNFLSNYKKSLISLGTVKLSEEDLNFLGFFNNQFNHVNFEFKFNGDFLDLVFLGFSEDDIDIQNNEKFLLHYLY